MTIRDDVREKQAELAALAKEQGVNLEDIRKETRGTGAVAAQIVRALNEPTPTEGRERLAEDDFAGQTFNGTNTDYTITRRVFGQNILVARVEQSTGTRIPLSRTSNPAPGGTEFYFDGYFTVRVGTPPGALDALTATYISAL